MLERIGHAAIVEHERKLTQTLDAGIRRIASVTVLGSGSQNAAGKYGPAYAAAASGHDGTTGEQRRRAQKPPV